MFNSTLVDAMDKSDGIEQDRKRHKLYDSKLIHSSLEYNSIRAPPLVVYKSIDSYCENNRGQPSCTTSSNSGLTNLQSVSSPIVLRTPREQRVKKILCEEALPHIFFTVEELSLVTSLKNWTSNKICAVGQVSVDSSNQKCYINSVCESGQWSLLLDTLLLEEIPKLQQLLQVYGTLMISDGQPYVKVYFTRNLSWVDLPLFVDSYRLMQKHMGTINCLNNDNTVHSGVESPKKVDPMQMNDTLDDCSLLL